MRDITKNTLPGIIFTVLIIDDSRFTLLTESMLLKQLGCRVFTADNTTRALNILSKQHIDLVLTDINMPEMRGDELACHIHELFPELPVVAITTARLEELTLRTEAGFKTILKKPLTAFMMRQTMRECFVEECI